MNLTQNTNSPFLSPPTGNGTEQRGRRSGSSGDVVVVDSNVLRKVASLTLDRATIEKRVVKPKFVPEKLDFKIYEKFEGEGKKGNEFDYCSHKNCFLDCQTNSDVEVLTILISNQAELNQLPLFGS